MTKEELATAFKQFADYLIDNYEALPVRGNSYQSIDNVQRREFAGLFNKLSERLLK